MPIQNSNFRELMGLFPTGVTVVTTFDRQRVAYGVTVSSFTSVSLDPPLVLICLDNRLSGLERFGPDCQFAIHFLSEDQKDISEYFATPATDRSFSSGLYDTAASGTPVLKNSLALMKCRLLNTFPGGDHTILLGSVTSTVVTDRSLQPLVYYSGQYRKLDSSSCSESSTNY